ncbi:hypothetical protein AOC36_07645 [Erysipelothrix larvae]|uniref:Gram-positive cocci surface proteins LPxTG domain-containing protein n=1 Tax=Erysipelothrix larvae TaxID=1514105 RepID=A0A0X8H0P3_9FIRM|nr:Cna B-type domain-containing protein [Erysipelothrix larvae]AMC93860.1 hypothetical protein AOC36_07645 [Erysipelothrix larvae]
MIKKMLVAFLCLLMIIVGNNYVFAENEETPITGNNVTNDFKIDSINISVAGKKVHNDNGVISVDDFSYNSGTHNLYFDLRWSAIDSNYDNYLSGDYIEFDILTVKGVENAGFKNLSQIRQLTDGNVVFAIGQLKVVKIDDTTSKLVYVITFNENIEGKDNISGGLDGGASYSGIANGETVEYSYGDETLVNVTVDLKPSSETIKGVIKPTDEPKNNKAVSSISTIDYTITWNVDVNNHLGNQFKDYESKYADAKYEDLIIEEVLDSNLSFTSESGSKKIFIDIPFYLYSDKHDENGKIIQYKSWFQYNMFDYFTEITSEGKSVSDVELAVRSQPLSFALITEQDPDNQGKTRERVIMNFGAPGSTGLRYTDLRYDGYVQFVNSLIKSQEYVNGIVEYGTAMGRNDSDVVSGDYEESHTFLEWKEMASIYNQSVDYYTEKNDSNRYIGPYVYNFSLKVVTAVKYKDIDTLNAVKVKNTVIIKGTDKDGDYSAEKDNFWKAYIVAKPTIGDAVIYKANKLYESGTNQEIASHYIKDVHFRVYKASDNTPILFNYSGGKYVYSPQGQLALVKTGMDGSLILNGLATGNYYLVEEASPDGFYQTKSGNEKISFTTSKYDISYITVTNVPRTVVWRKTDADNTQLTLQDAQFALYKCSDNLCQGNMEKVEGFTKTIVNGIEYYAYDGKGTDALISSSDGMVRVTYLDAGAYQVVEEKAPIGYQLSDHKITFILEEDYNNTDVINLGDFLNEKQLVTVSGTKTWVDDNNQEGFRPDAIELILKGNDEVVEGVTPTWTKVSDNVWSYTYENLLKYQNGAEIKYTVEEVPVAGYVMTQKGYDITNTRITSYTEVSGTKTWVDDNNREGFRPNTIELILKANNEVVQGVTPTWTKVSDNLWSYTYENLPQYQNGAEIKYTVEEVPVAGYVMTQKGYDITNTRITSYTEVSGTKTWVDNDNKEGYRPDSIQLILFANNQVVTNIEPTWVKDKNVWTYTFSNLPKYINGEEVIYTVKEVLVDNYQGSQDGFDLVNTLDVRRKTETITPNLPNTGDRPHKDVLPSTGVENDRFGFYILSFGMILLSFSHLSKKKEKADKS